MKMRMVELEIGGRILQLFETSRTNQVRAYWDKNTMDIRTDTEEHTSKDVYHLVRMLSPHPFVKSEELKEIAQLAKRMARP